MSRIARSLRRRAARVAVLVAGICSLSSCGEDRSADEQLRARQVTPGEASSIAPASPVARAAPATPGDLFPETGSRGLVVNNCATCHALACSAIGQRDERRWREVEASHLNAIPGLSIEDRGKIFDYLQRNFNETQAEPVVPPEFLERGCGEAPP